MPENSLIVKMCHAMMESGMLDENMLKTVFIRLKKTGQKFSKILIDLGYASEKQILDILLNKLDIPYFTFDGVEINPRVLTLIPFELANKCSSIPVFARGHNLIIATNDPFNVDSVKEISEYTKKRIILALTSTQDIQYAFNKRLRFKAADKAIQSNH